MRVRACSINHLDLHVGRGNPAYKIDLPHVLGSDIAGEIISAGPETELGGTPVGSKVIVSPGISCWECRACRCGRDNICESYAILGADGGWGGYAEIAVVPVKNLLPFPKADLTFEAAASYPLTFLTAYHMLKGLARVREGETVLVVGAGSGVGAAAIQIAKALGAKAIATSSAKEKLEYARELGADETIHTGSEKLTKCVKRLTAGRGADIVFEHVGGAIFADAVRLLAPGGRLATCGATAEPKVDLDLRYVFFKELQILGAKMGTLTELREIGALIEAGKLHPAVSRVFPLTEARQAQEYLAARKQFGKVVLRT
ncbi:MAG: zinc-binding dehydrogenase [Elusimicrobiota bacterium]